MESHTTRGPTRRDVIRGGGTIAIGGVLAGCTGSDGDSEPTPEPTTSETDAESTSTAIAEDDTHTVAMAPTGEVEFDSVPESAFVIFPQYADMAVALGHADAVNAVYVPEMSGTTMNTYYDRLEGVSFDWEELPDPLAEGVDREYLYELNSDVHFVDPAYMSTQDGWDESDLEEIASSVGPWFGNFYSGTRADPPAIYRDRYEYYDLWELFENVAAVFREGERYRELAAIHEELVATIRDGLPPEDERPTAVRVTANTETDEFYTYHLNEPGYWLADTQPLGATDAFAERDWTDLWGTVGYETMVEADPDVVLHLWGTTPSYDMAEIRETLADHPVGGELSAVQNDRVFAAGMRYQGPIMNLFQLEMGAKQLYPEQFGEWPGYEDGEPYPEIPADDQLFDRTELARIVTGDR